MRVARLWITIGSALICGVLILVLAKSFGSDPREVPFLLAGKPAPGFNLKDLSTGQRITRESFKGRPMVINFWATWCEPCKQEHPVIEWGAEQYGEQAQFIGVVFEDTEENVKQYLSQRGVPYPQMFDPLSRMAVDYGCSGVPETYFVDAHGTIVDKFVGPIDPQSLTEHVRRITVASAEANGEVKAP
jgi:cytochrome c biogenesis protein CcmG/thiol:disulfide interchange protein DsbE